jgi:hypothetical protein
MSTVISFAKSLVPEPLKHRWREFRWDPARLGDLPGSSRWFGPARRWVRAADYVRWHGGAMREVLPRQPLPPPNFVRCGPIPERFFSRLHADVPPASVLELSQVRLLGPDGWIVGARDSYVLDASYWAYPDFEHDIRDHYMLLRRFAPRIRRLPGRTLSLASDFAIGGFGHFVHDSLTRLCLLERAGIRPADFDWIYWPHLDSGPVHALVRASGVPLEKIVPWSRGHDLECESLTATTFPGRPGHIAPPYAEFLRRRFAPAAKQRVRKIYLSRAGHRRHFRNAASVEAVLARHGYETCLAHSDPDVFAKCAEATHVAAVEGASFFNTFCCAPGTKVLLILPDAGPTLPYALTLGLSAGHELYLLAATSLDQPQVDPGIADIQLDPAALDAALARMN